MTGEQYKEHREQMGLTQASLAQCLGIARETVVRREAPGSLVSREAQIAIRSLQLSNCAVFDARLGVPDHLAGVFAEDQLKAEGILEFACPSKGADGKWYRCTLATTNVPVAELYNILTSINFVAQRLRESGAAEHLVRELEDLHKHIKSRDRRRKQAAADGGGSLH